MPNKSPFPLPPFNTRAHTHAHTHTPRPPPNTCTRTISPHLNNLHRSPTYPTPFPHHHLPCIPLNSFSPPSPPQSPPPPHSPPVGPPDQLFPTKPRPSTTLHSPQ